MNSGYDIDIKSLIVTNVLEKSCTELSENLSSTKPELPVAHGTQITVQCKPGFINRGGKKVTCEYGEIVGLVPETPLCEIISTFT